MTPHHQHCDFGKDQPHHLRHKAFRTQGTIWDKWPQIPCFSEVSQGPITTPAQFQSVLDFDGFFRTALEGLFTAAAGFFIAAAADASPYISNNPISKVFTLLLWQIIILILLGKTLPGSSSFWGSTCFQNQTAVTKQPEQWNNQVVRKLIVNIWWICWVGVMDGEWCFVFGCIANSFRVFFLVRISSHACDI